MTEQERDQILLDIKKKVETTDVIVIDIKNKQEEMIKEQQEMKREQQEMKKEQQEMKKEQQAMKKEQQEIRKELTKIGNTVTRIEYEHGEKLDTLFDAFTIHSETLSNYKNRFKKDERIISKHSDEIYYIKTKLQA